MTNETKTKRYYVYEMGTNKNICYTDDFNHAFDLRKAFNENDNNNRYSIKVIYE